MVRPDLIRLDKVIVASLKLDQIRWTVTDGQVNI